jgi:formate hydrogenlyase transcriptional activator
MAQGEQVKGASDVERYQALLEVSDVLILHRDLPGLFHDLALRLPRVVPCDFLVFVMHDSQTNLMRLNLLAARNPTLPAPLPMVMPASEGPTGWAFEHQEPLVIPNVDQETRFPKVMAFLRERSIKSCCSLPLTTAQRRLGGLTYASLQENAYGGADLEFLRRVTEQVAVAVEGVLNLQAAQSARDALAHERDRLRLLLDISNVLVSNLEVRELFPAISASLNRVVEHDYSSLSLYDPERKQLRLHALDFPRGKGLVHQEYYFPVEGSPTGRCFSTGKPLLVDRLELAEFPTEITRRLLEEGVKSACWLPLTTRNGTLGTLSVASLRPSAFRQEDVELLSQVAGQVAIAIENALAFHQIAELKDKLAEEKLYLEDEIRSEYNFEEIVGQSPALKRILQQVETVAPTEAAVLILGDTGTGKELIARAIHELSARRERTFVKVNCAAIPTGLLESELFGHEKGAFTGAIAQKVGRFELAHQGTLFLDEVGDIPLELQPKLLRALQEQEFERLGSNRTIKVDARVLAATNRNLPKMVEEGTFRRDLYYRLSVFPIQVPPLRERQEDIPVLVRYFTQKYAKRMDRPIKSIPAEAMQAFQRWPWPGNVRELENFIERAVILTRGEILQVPLAELKPVAGELAGNAGSLEDAEREHIRKALKASKGVIGGPKGAATRLGLKRTTLLYKMKKLNLDPPKN